jgi:hypothetical protein
MKVVGVKLSEILKDPKMRLDAKKDFKPKKEKKDSCDVTTQQEILRLSKKAEIVQFYQLNIIIKKMRVLKLTKEQVAYIQQALGIAEKLYYKKHTDIIDCIEVRGNDYNKLTQRKQADFLFDLAWKFSDINYDLSNGNLDIKE